MPAPEFSSNQQQESYTRREVAKEFSPVKSELLRTSIRSSGPASNWPN
jgi:hypothetical protein